MSRFGRYDTADRGNFFGGGPLPGLKWLLIANGAVFLLMQVLAIVSEQAYGWVATFLAYSHRLAVMRGCAWQFVTYMFLHIEFLHILFNMFALYMFGKRLEERWGTRYFLKFYFVTGVGAAIVHELSCLVTGQGNAPMFGASGAVYGIMFAYAYYWKDDIIYVNFIFPMKVKYMVGLMALLNFFSSAQQLAGKNGDGIAHFTHLGGFLAAWLFLKYGDRGGRAMRNATRYFAKDFGRRRPKPVKLPRRPQYRDEDAWRRIRTA